MNMAPKFHTACRVGRAAPRYPTAALLFVVLLFPAVAPALQAATSATAGTRPLHELDLDAEEPWVQQQRAPADSPEGRLQTVRRALAEDRPRDAIRMLRDWERDYPNHPLLVEARLLRGDARVATGDFYGSLFDYEFVARGFPGTEQFNIALERLYEVGKLFLDGKTRRVWPIPFRLFTARSEAEEIMIRIQIRAPGSEIGERAAMTLAEHYFNRGQMRLAAEMYDIFLINYPRSPQREPAMRRLIQANLATFRGPRFDASGLLEARERLAAYQNEFPAAAERLGVQALLVRIEESLALKLLDSANWFSKRGQNVSAAYLYERVIREFPTSASARIAEQRLGELRPATKLTSLTSQSRPADDDSDVAPEAGHDDPAEIAEPAAPGDATDDAADRDTDNQ